MPTRTLEDDGNTLKECWKAWYGKDMSVLENHHYNDISKWAGVTTDVEKTTGLLRVTKIDWGHRGLDGPIPEQLGDLSELREVHLEKNNLQGGLPFTLAKLDKLRLLHLNGNPNLVGGLPEELDALLKRLEDDKDGSFSIDYLMNCTAKEWELRDQDKRILLECWLDMGMEKDDLVDPHRNGHNLKDIKSWGGLNSKGERRIKIGTRRHEVGYGRVIGIDWSGFNREKKLTGKIPERLSVLSMLKTLDLSSNELEGGIPKELAKLTHLEFLALSGNNLTVSIPTELAKLDKLKGLYLENNKKTGGYVVHLLFALLAIQILFIHAHPFSVNFLF